MDAASDAPPHKIMRLDGGKIAAAFSAPVLAAFEETVREPLGGYFDLIAGTQTCRGLAR